MTDSNADANGNRSASPKDIVARFWMLMASNDFASVSEVCHDDLVLDWPQTGERIRSVANFVRMNVEYPAKGRWRFDVRRILADGAEVVSEVDITDGVQRGHAISFFTIRDGRIQHILEYWPDPSLPHNNRAHLVEPLPKRDS
jgi:ketosteroid isomerase-like protein